MTGALLGTKLYVPQLRRGSVGRPRLMRRMEAGAEARLTLVSAPAGFGKTTLLAAMAARGSRDGPLRGVALARRHGQRTRVVLDLRGDRARRAQCPGVGTGALELSRLPPPTDPSSPRC